MSNRQSYLAKQEENKKNRQAAGLVSEKFPNVEVMVIDMVYYQNLSNPILMYRKLNVFPGSYAYFKMDCMIKECEDGFFDLRSVIRDMVNARKKTAKGFMKCKGGANRKDLGPDHASIDYDISIKYYTAAAAKRVQADLAAKKVAKVAETVKPEAKAATDKPKRRTAIKAAAKAASKKADIKKADIKKADTKKADIKKADTKKADIKKAVTKKVATKKVATKKVATKKAVTKKAATKKATSKKKAARR